MFGGIPHFPDTEFLKTKFFIHETVSFPRQIVSYPADFPANFVEKVKEVLLNMHQTEDSRQVLQAFESTTKFAEIPVRDVDLATGLRKHVDAELKLQRVARPAIR